MKEDRGSWYLLTAIVLGIGLGLLYSWIISPIEYVDTPPLSLRKDYKDQYRAVIAVAYAATGNLERAKNRLALLGDEDSAVFLVAQAQRTLAGEGDFGEAQALANLAAALGQAPTPFPSETILTSTQVPSQILTSTASDSLPPTPNYTQTPSPTNVLTSTDTVKQTIEVTTGPAGTATVFGTLGPTRPTTQITYLAPSLTPTATLSPPFVLDNRVEVCNPLLTEPQIQVFVSNTAGIGIPGIEIIISWNGGEEHFYTGIKTDIDIGYADFVMEPEILYVLQVANGGQLIADLTAPQCKNEAGIVFWGSLRLVFTHP